MRFPFSFAGRRARSDAQLEAALRATLTEHARRAPAADVLAERILAAVDAPSPAHDFVPRPHRTWRSWATPLVAASSVALVAAVAVGLSNLEPDATTAARPGVPIASPDGSRSIGADGRHSRFGVNGPMATETLQAKSPTPDSATQAPTAALRGVRVFDLTFAGTDDGWALASARCLYGAGRCTALLRTRDGSTWTGIPGAAFNVGGPRGCARPCVWHLRFANDRVGYAFGPSAMFMTLDGGHRWQREPGGALALETLDGNVIRITSPHSGCPGPCDVRVETAPIGSTVWTPARLPGAPTPGTGWSGTGVQFARGGSDAYLLITGNPAGGAGSATSTLLRSVDDGQTWTSSGEPCPQSRGEVDSHLVTAGGDGRVTVLCGTRIPPQRWFVATSLDAGAHFTAQPGAIPPAAADGLLTGDPSTVLVSTGRRMARSTDGGRSWRRVGGLPRGVTFVGFESASVGRVIAQDGRSVWTTRDGGATWTRATGFR